MSLVGPLLTRIFMTWYRLHPFQNCSKCSCLSLCPLQRLKGAGKRGPKRRTPPNLENLSLAPRTSNSAKQSCFLPPAPPAPHTQPSPTKPTHIHTHTYRETTMAGPDTMEISSGGGVEETKTPGEPKPQQVTTTNANAAMVRFCLCVSVHALCVCV